MNHFQYIFRPVGIKDLIIPNRIVFPPTVTTYSHNDGSISIRQKSYYELIAKSGVGLVIVGGTAVSQEGLFTIRCSRIDKDDYIKGLGDLFAVINSQLGHSP